VTTKVLFVLDNVPHPHYSGTGVTASALVSSLLKSDYSVHILALRHDKNSFAGGEKAYIQHWNDLGIRVDILDDTKNMLFDSIRKYISKFILHPKYLFAGTFQRNEVQKIVEENRVDMVVGYHWDAAAATDSIALPRYILVGDPIHLPILFAIIMAKKHKVKSLSFETVKRWVANLLASKYIRGMVYLLNNTTASWAFAAHHAEQLQGDGAVNCKYIHTPVNDPLINSHNITKPDYLKILHIGHLKGTATLSGVELIAEEILPYLRSEFKTQFELHFVGAFHERMPETLRKNLEFSEVKFRGQITPPDDEFLSSQCLLVSTPIELGIRVRIITALSFGCCVVAHTANAKGIPELIHGYNCLLAETGQELAMHCISVFENPELRLELEKNARKTYEDYFSPDAVGGELMKIIDGS